MNDKDLHADEIEDSSDDDDEVPLLLNVDEVIAIDDEESEELEVVILPPCPVTILSGFLGSGKTTLIQHILQSPDHGKRIAVIENEFGGGNEGISVENIIARDGANQESLADLIELPNGCICCTVKDSLVETLENLLEKRRDLDYIIIEASGMANPGPIASLFWLDDELESRLRLDGVVTLVDALNLEQQLMQTEEAAQQIAYADRILLNKIDLVDNKTDSALKRIRVINPTCPVRCTTYSLIPDLEWILDANCFNADDAKEVSRALAHVASPDLSHECTDTSCQTCTHLITVVPKDILGESTPDNTPDANYSTHHTHTSGVSTVALVRQSSVDLTRMNAWLASLLWPNQDEKNSTLKARLEADPDNEKDMPPLQVSTEMQIFRIKGILAVQHRHIDSEDIDYVDDNGVDVRRYIVQAVHDLWEIHPASEDLRWDCTIDGEAEVSQRSCKVVVIGKNLNEFELREGFRRCQSSFVSLDDN